MYLNVYLDDEDNIEIDNDSGDSYRPPCTLSSSSNSSVLILVSILNTIVYYFTIFKN